MKRLVPDPFQLFDHEGNPEDGPERFIEIDSDPMRISPELELWLERKHRERHAKQEVEHYRANPPHHKPRLSCPRCGDHYWEIGLSNGHCALCLAEVDGAAQFQLQVEDIHP